MTHAGALGGLETRPESRLGAGELALLVLLVGLCRLLALHSFPIYDDAFITFRYARNLAEGHGLVYNPGAPWEPVLGTTTPFYALLLAACAWLGLDPLHASVGVNILCDCASALLLAQLLGGRRLAAGVTLYTFATLPPLVRIAVGGMEPPVLLILTLGAVALAQRGRLAPAGVLAALACVVRPEAVLLVAILAAVHLRSTRQALAFLSPVAAIGLASLAALWISYGHPLPQSVRAKAATHGLGLRIHRMLQVLQQAFLPLAWTAPALPLVALGCVRALRSERGLRSFCCFALAMTLAYLLAGVKTWGWYYQIPLTAWCVGFGLGAERLLSWRTGPRAALDRAGVTCAAAFVLLAATLGLTRLYPDRITPGVYVPMRAWAEREGLATNGRQVEASDIGAIGYYSRAMVLDSEGLVWPGARSYRGQLALIRARRPEYVLMVAERGRLAPFQADPVFQDYRPVARFNAAGEADLDPDPATLPEHWTQDYIIYARQDGDTGESGAADPKR